jgi:hypothetical protein
MICYVRLPSEIEVFYYGDVEFRNILYFHPENTTSEVSVSSSILCLR